MALFKATFDSCTESFEATFESQRPFESDFGALTTVEEKLEEYDGDIEVTPSDNEQILATAGKKLISNIIVKPVPSNYGKIIWNGITMTIV